MNVFVSYDKDAYDDSGPGAPPSPEKQRFVSGGHIQPNGKASTPDTTSTKSITVDHVKSKPINYKKHQLVSSHSFKKKPHTPLRHSSDHFESTASRSALNSSGKSGERQIDQIRRSMERQRDDPQEISVYSISVEAKLEDLYTYFSQHGFIRALKLYSPTSTAYQKCYIEYDTRSGLNSLMKTTENGTLRCSLGNLSLRVFKSKHPSPPLQRMYVDLPPPKQRVIIDELASELQEVGAFAVDNRMRGLVGNPNYAFYFDKTLPEHQFYLWRVYSLGRGDTLTDWNDRPYQLTSGGQVYIPPECQPLQQPPPDIQLLPSDMLSRGERLSEKAESVLETMLRELDGTREAIRECMHFAFDHVNSAPQVVTAISLALLDDKAEARHKIALLFAVSDILVNAIHICGDMEDAKLYKYGFDLTLPKIFASFARKLRTIQGRISVQNVKEQLVKVLQAWDKFSIFPGNVLDSYYHIFTEVEVRPDNVDGQPMRDSRDDIMQQYKRVKRTAPEPSHPAKRVKR